MRCDYRPNTAIFCTTCMTWSVIFIIKESVLFILQLNFIIYKLKFTIKQQNTRQSTYGTLS